ncbi:MAG TPA: peptidoglycan-binding protein [Xanthobacteraceae bacterium]|jgi:hypothetical protein|nr:peptidoglycan-binding protein [Xanthobacteraceae bacterium]
MSLAVALLLAGDPAFAQQTSKPAPTKTAPAEAVHKPTTGKTARATPSVNAAMPSADRLAATADVVWLGSYAGFSADEIEARADEAIKSFQKRNGGKETGMLTDQERALLADAAKGPQSAVGWRVVDDSATGARLGIPEKLVPKATTASLGSRWSASRGSVQIETFRLHEASLPMLFEQEKKTAQRQIGYSALGADSFVIRGDQHLKKFVMRAQVSGGEVRGVTVLYDHAIEGTIAAIAVAIADGFVGFPDAKALSAHKRGVEYGSAIVVSAHGDLLAPLDITDECQSLTVAGFGHADRIAQDKANGLALLRLYGARNLTPASLGDDGTAASDLTLFGVADPLTQPGDAAVTKASASLSAQGVTPAPQPGFSGAAALDRQGRFIGVVVLKPQLLASAGMATSLATLIPAATVRAFLTAQGIDITTGSNAADQSVLRLICVRK